MVDSILVPVDVTAILDKVDNGASTGDVLRSVLMAGFGKLAPQGAKNAVPEIKPGAAGGETAGKAFPQAVKDAAKADPRQAIVVNGPLLIGK